MGMSVRHGIWKTPCTKKHKFYDQTITSNELAQIIDKPSNWVRHRLTSKKWTAEKLFEEYSK